MYNNINKLILFFFKKLNISVDSIDIIYIKNKNYFKVSLLSNDFKKIELNDGDIIYSIQNILNLFFLNLDNKIKLEIFINDNFNNIDDKLYNLINKKIILLKKTYNNIELPNYSTYERKKIHSYVSYLKNDNIYTKSIGKGKNRRIFLCIKPNKLSIDIDGTDI